MSDIVDRLRAAPVSVPLAETEYVNVCDEAADEIERLREVLQLRTDAYDAIMAAISRRTLGEAMDAVKAETAAEAAKDE